MVGRAKSEIIPFACSSNNLLLFLFSNFVFSTVSKVIEIQLLYNNLYIMATDWKVIDIQLLWKSNLYMTTKH